MELNKREGSCGVSKRRLRLEVGKGQRYQVLQRRKIQTRVTIVDMGLREQIGGFFGGSFHSPWLPTG